MALEGLPRCLAVLKEGDGSPNDSTWQRIERLIKLCPKCQFKQLKRNRGIEKLSKFLKQENDENKNKDKYDDGYDDEYGNIGNNNNDNNGINNDNDGNIIGISQRYKWIKYDKIIPESYLLIRIDKPSDIYEFDVLSQNSVISLCKYLCYSNGKYIHKLLPLLFRYLLTLNLAKYPQHYFRIQLNQKTKKKLNQLSKMNSAVTVETNNGNNNNDNNEDTNTAPDTSQVNIVYISTMLYIFVFVIYRIILNHQIKSLKKRNMILM